MMKQKGTSDANSTLALIVPAQTRKGTRVDFKTHQQVDRTQGSCTQLVPRSPWSKS